MNALTIREPRPGAEHPDRTHRAAARGTRWRELRPVVGSAVVCAVLLPAVVYGLFSASAYRGYSPALSLSSRAQDVFTAAMLPVLLWTAVKARQGSLAAHLGWLGLMFYVAYSYSIYLIGWPQNRVFLLYVVAVLVATASLLDGLVRIELRRIAPAVRRLRTRAVGWFLVVIGVAFTALWLSDVAPSAFGGRAPSVHGIGGTPYAVYVLDLVVALPIVVATGILLIRRHPAGPVLGGVVLVKITTLFTALWLGVLAQLLAGEHVPFTADMVPSALLLVVTVTVIARSVRRLERPADGWLRSQLWPDEPDEPDEPDDDGRESSPRGMRGGR
jgi:hypothetical protein